MKLINEKLVKFDCCRDGKIVVKWWKNEGSSQFCGVDIYLRGGWGNVLPP